MWMLYGLVVTGELADAGGLVRSKVRDNPAMGIRAFGLFWRADEVDWEPGRGNAFHLLGRNGMNLPKRRIVDFRDQQGLYILYGNYGPHYVGLTQKSLGKRLKDHTLDKHAGKWDRFSWFGFRPVMVKKVNGLNQLKVLPTLAIDSPQDSIADMEALLIKALGLADNKNNMNFQDAIEWEQIKLDELEKFGLE
jgi:hypothetical protein